MSRWIGLVVAATLVAGGTPALAAQGPTERVVVVLRGQAAPGWQPRHVRDFALGHAFAADVSPSQVATLAHDPAVADVVPDVTVHLPVPHHVSATTAQQPGKRTTAPNTCPADPAHPLLEPEALRSVHAVAAHQLATGKGVTVGYIADGIDPDNPDFVRPDGTSAITRSVDFSGNPATDPTGGAEAFGDASSIAAQGVVSHDLSAYVSPAHPLPAGCDIRILGVAPDANVVAIDAIDGQNDTTISTVLQSIDYAVNVAHVNVLNESFGVTSFPDAGSRDAVELFNDKAIAAGVTVTVASGDAGLTSTIDDPAADPNVISVGASTDFQAYTQIGQDGTALGSGGWLDDNVSAITSGGFTQGGSTLDLLAPGQQNWAACTPQPRYTMCVDASGRPSPVLLFGGTSEAAPLTAGTAALVIQAYRQAHGGRSPSPAQVKQFIVSTADDLGLPAQDQGAGLLDARSAVSAALGRGHLLVDRDRLVGTGAPGSSRTDRVGVTNAGSTPVTVTAGMHDYVSGTSTTQDVALDAAKDPTFPGVDGTAQAYRKATFTVHPGADVLAVNAAWPGSSLPAAGFGGDVAVSLFDPAGRLAADSWPQGEGVSGNYANPVVRKPSAGTWTALLYTDSFTGTVHLSATEQHAAPTGHVSPSTFTLAPGQHRDVTVTSTFPTTGDTADSVTFAAAGATTTVPDLLRALLPLPGTFSGTITGGNGRGGDPAQTFTYAFDVPAGAPGLNVSTTLARDENQVLQGVLLDPNGETRSIGTNLPIEQVLDPTNVPDHTDPSLSMSVADPQPGRWRFVLAPQNPVPGTALGLPFTGTVSLHSAVTATAHLPATLPAGKPTTATVTLTNTSPATVYVQADARTATVGQVKLGARLLPGQGMPSTVTLPITGFNAPSYLVPPDTTALTATATSTVANQVELASVGTSGAWGGLDAVGGAGTTSTATLSEPNGPLGQGDWTVATTEIGPFGPDGEPRAQADLAVTATTLGFDSSVTSSTGDPYAESLDGDADAGTPLAVAPGKTATITLTITPTAPAGTTVDGTLNIVSPGDATLFGRVLNNLVVSSGDVLAAVPYRYTVG